MAASQQSVGERARRFEHSVPYFWPLISMMEVGEANMQALDRSLATLREIGRVDLHGGLPGWASPNRIVLELHTLRLRDFSRGDAGDGIPVVINPPYAGHSSMIADYHRGQSLVETLVAGGCKRVLAFDWNSATIQMKDYDIDNYLAEVNVAVDDLGGRVDLIGLCQGGWLSAMFAARYPRKVRSLVLAGAPIDAHAGSGPLKHIAESTPMTFYQELVALGGGVLRGRTMLAAWKGMNPERQYVGKYVDLYEHVEDPAYRSKFEAFERWYENPVDLPGRWYLQVIEQLFKQNLFARGRFKGLGRTLSLADVDCPAYLLAGEKDDITPREQVFAAKRLLGTPTAQVVEQIVPGGHVGLFMGHRALGEYWPAIAKWIGGLA